MAWGKIGADTATSATPTLKVDIATPNNFVSFMNHIFVNKNFCPKLKRIVISNKLQNQA